MSTMREVQQNWTEITRRLLERQEYLKFLPFSANLYGLPFSNAALVYHQNPECKRAATAAQWNSIHFVVKRGEHGITVFDETNRNNALSFLFDESQVASSQKTVMPQRMDFSAYEEQLCQAFGQRQGKAYSNLQALCAGMVQHFMSDPKATLLLQENERTMGLHDTQKQQYEESVASVCCYVAMLRCFPEKEIQQPDLSAFDFFRNDIANLIRFGNIVQKIYGNVLKKLEKNVRAIEKNREVEINDKNRTDRFQGSTERTESYHQQPDRIMGASGTDRIGAEIHDAMGHDTGRSAQSDGEKHRRTLGQDLAAVDAAESSQSMAAADTGERLPTGNPDDRNRPDRRGDVSEENAAIPTGESSAGQETEPESLSGVGQESDSGSSAASVGRDRVSDAADTVTTTEKESQAEAENPSVSAFSISEKQSDAVFEIPEKDTETVLRTAFSEVRSQFSLTEKQEKFLSRMESFAVRNSVTENLLEQMSQLPVFRQAYGNPRILSKSVFQGRLQRVMDTLETAIQKQISVQSPSEKASFESTLENQNSLKKEDSSTDEIPEHSEEHQNYRITDDSIGIGTPRERIQANLTAIRTLKEIEQRKTPAATEEKALLSEYVGWGGLPQIFEPDNHFYNELKELLTDAEYTAARASTNTAFYTPPVVIRSIYQYLEAVGITSGSILEPSCGIGTFLGMRPDSMRNCNFYGVELDSISGRIAQQLYPLDNISITGFEKTNFPDGMFTAAIGNVPFGDFQLFDPKYDKQHFLIHDYFFAKALDQICPGGIVTFITSKGTMDKENSAVRRYLAERAELIGAVRLPNNTFSSAAGTEVTSDILFLRRRTEPMQGQPEWVNLDTNENGIRMNAYFVSHPEMVLGEMQMISGRFGMETACVGNSSEPLSQMLERAVSTLPVTSAPMPIQEQTEVPVIAVDSDSLRDDSFIVHGNMLLYKQTGQAEPFDFASSGLPKRLEKKAEGILRDMIPLRDTVRELIQLQLDGADDSDVTQMQKHLEAVYDNFVGKHGRMTEKDNRAVLELDSSYHLLCSLEIHDDNGEFLRKSDFFTKRTVRQQI